jgi:hypothetical protein
MAAKEPAIYIQGDATDTLYLNPVPTPETSPIPPADGEDPFGVIYVSSGDLLSPNVGHPYYRKPSDGQTFDLLQASSLSTATFITVVTEPTLPLSRRLAVTSDMSLSDGGALGPITIGLSPTNSARLATIGTATFITVVNEPGLPASRFLNAGTRITIADGGSQSTVTVSVDAATDTLLTNLATAPFLFPINEAANFPQSRQVTAGAGVVITDNGAGSTFVLTVEFITAPFILFAVTPAGTTTTPVVGQVWDFSKVGKRVTAIFDTLLSIDGGPLGILSVIAPPGSIPVGFRPAINVELVGRFVGLTSLVFSSTWAILANGEIVAAAVPSPVTQFTPGFGRGWVACALTWTTA